MDTNTDHFTPLMLHMQGNKCMHKTNKTILILYMNTLLPKSPATFNRNKDFKSLHFEGSFVTFHPHHS